MIYIGKTLTILIYHFVLSTEQSMSKVYFVYKYSVKVLLLPPLHLDSPIPFLFTRDNKVEDVILNLIGQIMHLTVHHIAQSDKWNEQLQQIFTGFPCLTEKFRAPDTYIHFVILML